MKWRFGIFVSHFLMLWRCFLFDFLGVFDKGDDFKFLMCDVCFLLCYLGFWWVLCFLWLVCKLTTYTDIGKMGVADLFFVPPP